MVVSFKENRLEAELNFNEILSKFDYIQECDFCLLLLNLYKAMNEYDNNNNMVKVVLYDNRGINPISHSGSLNDIAINKNASEIKVQFVGSNDWLLVKDIDEKIIRAVSSKNFYIHAKDKNGSKIDFIHVGAEE